MSVKPKIIVIGDIMIDHYLWGRADRISPEAPVQIVDIHRQSEVLGGAGNVVNNLRAFGCDVAVLSCVGDDIVADNMRQMLDDIDTKHILTIQKHRKSSKKSRLIASHQQVVRYDEESKEDIATTTQKKIFKEFESIVGQFDIVVLSDYGKGVLTDSLTKDIIKLSNKYDKKVLIDPKGDNWHKYRGAYILTPNRTEASNATKIDIEDENSTKKALKIMSDIVKVPLITLSEDGIAILDSNGDMVTSPTVAREVYDVTGAGDTVIAGIAYSLATNKSLTTALKFANLAAGVVVGKLGSATATLDEIEIYKASLRKSSPDSHIKSFSQVEKAVKTYKIQNKKIVFTNGCFDILHKGHASYLHTAKSFGDILIVGVNSDKSVRELKGANRPINTQNDRAYILASLESVDMVVIFDEETPYNLIKLITPDVLVKGGDYIGKDVVGQDIAGSLRLVDFIDGRSTTKVIQSIQDV